MEMFDCGTNNRNRTIQKLFVIQITVFDGRGIFNFLSKYFEKKKSVILKVQSKLFSIDETK